MLVHRVLRFSGILMVLLLVVSTAARADYGVFLYPGKTGANDNGPPAAVALGKSLQKDGLVSSMIEVTSAQQYIDTMAALKNAGKPVNLLVIASHGTENDPGLQFGPGSDGAIGYANLNLDVMQSQLDGLYAGRDRQRQQGTVNPQTQKLIDELEQQIGRYQAIGQAMAPGAQILLVNCDAAGSKNGIQFIENFGSLMLPRGGRIIASSTKVAVGEINHFSDALGIYLLNLGTGKKTYNSGNVRLGGNFKNFDFYGPLSGSWQQTSRLGTRPIVFQSGTRNVRATVSGFSLEGSWTGRRLRGSVRLRSVADVYRYTAKQWIGNAPPEKVIQEVLKNNTWEVSWDLLADSPTSLTGLYTGASLTWDGDKLNSFAAAQSLPVRWVKQQ